MREEDDGLLESVKTGLSFMAQAMKSCAVYPEGHSFRVDSLSKFREWLEEFFAADDPLRLVVEGDRLLYRGETAYLEKTGDLSLTFPLFRDGVQWIEFQPGLTIEEALSFFALLNNYRNPREDAEDDLVTAIWDAGFQSITYKTVNELWDIDPLPGLNAAGLAGPGGTPPKTKPLGSLFQEAAGQTAGGERTREVQAEEDAGQEELWRLTGEETAALKAFMDSESRRDFVKDGLDVVMVLLRSRGEADGDRSELLAFLADQVKTALAGGQFQHLSFICRSFDEAGGDPAARLEFQKSLADPAVLAPLAALWPKRRAGREELIELRTFLLFLPPAAIGGLAAACARAVNREIQRLLLSALAYLLGRSEMNHTSQVTAHLPPALILDLLTPPKNKTRNWPLYFLEELTRHRDPGVRLAAADLIFRTSPSWLKLISHLATDRDPQINQFICDLLSRQRNSAAETVLREHLERCYASQAPWPQAQLLNCYLAFGSCASQEGAEFPQRVLLKTNLKSIFGAAEDDSPHRLGAALALMRMPQEWSGEALRKAANSSFKQVRQAVAAAEARLAAKGQS